MKRGAIGRRACLFSLADLAWSSLVVAPLVVLFWRGTWDILNLWVYPEFPALDSPNNAERLEKSSLVCFVLGLVLRILLDLAKPFLGEALQPKDKIIKHLGRLVFTGLYSLAGVSFWRGTWYLMRLDVGENTLPLLVVLVGGVAVIVFSKISRTLISSPLSLGQDSHDTTFEAASFFRKTPDTAAWFVADVLFSNLVVRLLVVFCWWSLWSLEDGVLILNIIGVKDDKVAYDSIILGYTTTVLVFLADKSMIRPTKLYINKILECILTLLGFFASVNVWRGVWSLYDNYLFPGVGRELNYLASSVAGFLLLAVMWLSNSISMDHIVADEAGANIFRIEYWRRDRAAGAQDDEMIPIVE